LPGIYHIPTIDPQVYDPTSREPVQKTLETTLDYVKEQVQKTLKFLFPPNS